MDGWNFVKQSLVKAQKFCDKLAFRNNLRKEWECHKYICCSDCVNFISTAVAVIMKCLYATSNPLHAITCFKDRQVHTRMNTHAIAFAGVNFEAV